MYSESDIETAVASGALSAEAAAALRASVAAGRAAPAVDEESFRLLTGFNDIFVSIAAVLLLVAVGWIGASIGGSFDNLPGDDGAAFRMLATRSLLGSAAVAATSWLLAEYFTRRRRMALPSILLLGTFALGVGAAVQGVARIAWPTSDPQGNALLAAVSAIAVAGAAYLHWRRFHVPITIAALTGAVVAALVSLVLAAMPASREAWLAVLLLAGLGIFAFAMWWDMSDRARITRRSDVAFWLHLAAAPMIAHPIFNLLGVLGATVTIGTAVAVILLYLLFGFVALAVDRRALLVSGLAYVLYALAGLFRQFGAVSLNVALTAMVIGSALLVLSAFWHTIRRRVIALLPGDLQQRLPVLDRPGLTPRPA